MMSAGKFENSPELGKGFHEPGRQAVQPGEEEILSLEETLEAYNYQMQDPSYVPSIEEFEAMENLAEEHIVLVLPSSGGVPIKYIGKDSSGHRKLNSYQVRFFLDRIKEDKWSLTEDEAGYAVEVMHRSNRQLRGKHGGGGLDTGREFLNVVNDDHQRHGALLDWIEFLNIAELDSKNVNMIDEYRKHVTARFELDAMINTRRQTSLSREATA